MKAELQEDGKIRVERDGVVFYIDTSDIPTDFIDEGKTYGLNLVFDGHYY